MLYSLSFSKKRSPEVRKLIAVLREEGTIEASIESFGGLMLFSCKGFKNFRLASKRIKNLNIEFQITKTIINNEYHNLSGRVVKFMGKYSSATKSNKNNPKDRDSVKDSPIDKFIGIEPAIQDIQRIIAGIKFRQDAKDAGLRLDNSAMNNIIISGPSGVGKTTLAKATAEKIRSEVTSNKGPVVFISAQEIISRYLGGTTNKLKAKINNAKGGVLIIDEIDVWLGIVDFGQEAIDFLNTYMGNNPNNPIIIATLYEENIHRFLSSNRGLNSRFSQQIKIKPYNHNILSKILEQKMLNANFKISTGVMDEVRSLTKRLCGRKNINFGNAREMDNLFELIVGYVSIRYETKKGTDITTIMLGDIPKIDRNSGELVMKKERPIKQIAPKKVGHLNLVT